MSLASCRVFTGCAKNILKKLSSCRVEPTTNTSTVAVICEKLSPFGVGWVGGRQYMSWLSKGHEVSGLYVGKLGGE